MTFARLCLPSDNTTLFILAHCTSMPSSLVVSLQFSSPELRRSVDAWMSFQPVKSVGMAKVSIRGHLTGVGVRGV